MSPFAVSQVADPLQALFELLDQEPVTFRGISGRARYEAGDLYFYPDEAGLASEAYQADVDRLGDVWYRWYVSDDTQALAELAQAAAVPFVVCLEAALPVGSDVAPFAQWVEQLLTDMGLD